MIGHASWRDTRPKQMLNRATHTKMAAPWAAAAMLGAFAGGTLLGMFTGKKAAYNKMHESGSKMMKHHHHHGYGAPACTKKHKHEEEREREHMPEGGAE